MPDSSDENENENFVLKIRAIKEYAIEMNEEIQSSISNLDKTKKSVYDNLKKVTKAVNDLTGYSNSEMSLFFWMLVSSCILFFLVYWILF